MPRPSPCRSGNLFTREPSRELFLHTEGLLRCNAAMPASHSYYARIGASYHFEEEWLIFACNCLVVGADEISGKTARERDQKMKSGIKMFRPFAILILAIALLPSLTFAQYVRTDLTSNQNGVAPNTSEHLVNAWGLVQLQFAPSMAVLFGSATTAADFPRSMMEPARCRGSL